MASHFSRQIVAAAVFVKGDSTTIESLTSASLKLSLAAWAVSEAVAGRSLTLRRTLVAAIVLYGIAFVLMAVFLGKPLSTKVAEVNEEQRQLDARFAETAIGKTLLQPQSFASPQVAATSLAEFEQYANATKGLNDRKETLLQRDPSSRDAMAPYFAATRVVASTSIVLLLSRHVRYTLKMELSSLQTRTGTTSVWTLLMMRSRNSS